MNMDCLFCKIGAGEIPSHKVNEDDQFIAFLEIKPHSKGHTVIIPKEHGVTIFDYEEYVLKKITIFIKQTMKKLQEKLSPDGYNVGWNHNPAGGQVVKHLHIHIFPRWHGDGGGSMHSIVNNSVDVEEVAKLF